MHLSDRTELDRVTIFVPRPDPTRMDPLKKPDHHHDVLKNFVCLIMRKRDWKYYFYRLEENYKGYVGFFERKLWVMWNKTTIAMYCFKPIYVHIIIQHISMTSYESYIMHPYQFPPKAILFHREGKHAERHISHVSAVSYLFKTVPSCYQ
jgi:hypothetical protein